MTESCDPLFFVSVTRTRAAASCVQSFLAQLFEDVIDDGLAFQRENLTEPVPTVPVQQVVSLTNLFLAMFKQVKWKWNSSVTGEREPACVAVSAWVADGAVRTPRADLTRNVGSLFAFAFLWSIGGSITDEGDGYAKMDTFMRSHKAFSQVCGVSRVCVSFCCCLCLEWHRRRCCPARVLVRHRVS